MGPFIASNAFYYYRDLDAASRRIQEHPLTLVDLPESVAADDRAQLEFASHQASVTRGSSVEGADLVDAQSG